MKRLKFPTRTLNIKEATLRKLIDSTIYSKSITREEVASNAGVSLATAGKLLSSMDECGFTKLAFDRSGARHGREKMHLLSPALSILVLNFSSHNYSASIQFDRGERVITEVYDYDPKISFENNALIFLSSVGRKVSGAKITVSSICAIVPDAPLAVSKSTLQAAYYSPSLSELRAVDDICFEFFNLAPIKITFSESVRCAARFGYIDHRKAGNVSYIRLIDPSSAFYLQKKQAPVSFCLQRLVCDGRAFSDILVKSETSREAAKLLMRIANNMDCAYPTDSFIIEYDRGAFDEKIEECFYLSFKAAGIPVPRVEFWSHTAPPYHLGAGAYALSELIKTHIRGV